MAQELNGVALAGLTSGSETAAHLALKRAALIWAQANGYSACSLEVTLPHCRYRADVAGYRPEREGIGRTAIFECKQVRCDLRRDNCDSAAARARLELVCRRREIIERNLRVHYPALRAGESLFAEFDGYDFAATSHRNHARVLREIGALQNRLFDCTKFEKLLRYRCANLLFLVVPEELFEEALVPVGWGALVEHDGKLELARKAPWQENAPAARLSFLERIARAGTRLFNRQAGITFEEVASERAIGR
jgi:hypothetical protein